jgi:hypothetical protein
VTASGDDVGYIRSESIRYGSETAIEGFIEVYDSVVEGNGRIAI